MSRVSKQNTEAPEFRIRWDYIPPEWYISEEETPINNDLSAFADWEHPAEVTEEKERIL